MTSSTAFSQAICQDGWTIPQIAACLKQVAATGNWPPCTPPAADDTAALGGACGCSACKRKPAVIEPEPFEHEGMRVICYPGDAAHSVRERVLPGPTRLCFRNKRFEPVDGFDAHFQL